MITRHHKAGFINSVINDPSVRDGAEIKDIADVSAIVADVNNFVLATDYGGFVVIKKMTGIYECHTQFLPEGRGAHAVEAVRDALRYMFLKTDCIRIVTKVALENKAVQHFTAQFFRKRGKTETHFYYSMDFDDWVVTDSECAATGEAFHESLDEVDHNEDPVHDSYVGAVCKMAKENNIYKAQLLYNRWAVMAGFEPFIVLSEHPLVIQAGAMKIALDGGITCL